MQKDNASEDVDPSTYPATLAESRARPRSLRSDFNVLIPFLNLDFDVYALAGLQVLANGEEVKLQRNALSVVEYGPEDVQVCFIICFKYLLLLHPNRHGLTSAWRVACRRTPLRR
jgi:hypothetical protein